jgi:hypothetical protein
VTPLYHCGQDCFGCQHLLVCIHPPTPPPPAPAAVFEASLVVASSPLWSLVPRALPDVGCCVCSHNGLLASRKCVRVHSNRCCLGICGDRLDGSHVYVLSPCATLTTRRMRWRSCQGAFCASSAWHVCGRLEKWNILRSLLAPKCHMVHVLAARAAQHTASAAVATAPASVVA